jgi:hypothetical protein
MMEPATIGNIEEWPACRPLQARPDGALIVTLRGREQAVMPAGVELTQPPSSAYFEFVERLSKMGEPMRCRVGGRFSEGVVHTEIVYFGWQDKSGAVWLDLAAALVEHGFARPATAVPGPEGRP